VFKPQFSEENSYIKTVKIFLRLHVKTKLKSNSMADCSNLLCEMLGSSTCRNFLSRMVYEILTDSHYQQSAFLRLPSK